jgi:Ca-activated chloride channel family protein
MKWLVPAILIAVLGIDPGLIARINSAKSAAKKAFLAGDYRVAISKYRYLVDSLGVKEDEVLMNLAHSYFNQNDTTNAQASYQKLLTNPNANKALRSNAFQQLGVINNRQGKLEEALANFKEALKSDPTNEDARYDYEMVKKKLEEKKKQEEQQKKDQEKKDDQQQNKDQQQKDKQNQDKNKQDQQKKDQQDKEQQQKEQAEKDKKEQEQKAKEQKEQEQKDQKEQKDKKDNKFNPDKLKDIKVTEEKAKMILEAMKNQEKQYLQQNKRKAEKPRDKGKPDW